MGEGDAFTLLEMERGGVLQTDGANEAAMCMHHLLFFHLAQSPEQGYEYEAGKSEMSVMRRVPRRTRPYIYGSDVHLYDVQTLSALVLKKKRKKGFTSGSFSTRCPLSRLPWSD